MAHYKVSLKTGKTIDVICDDYKTKDDILWFYNEIRGEYRTSWDKIKMFFPLSSVSYVRVL